MRLLRLSDYKNVLPMISLSSDEIKEIVRNHKLRFINVKNDVVEWNLRLPVFARPFYAYIYRKNNIPTQEEFYEYYVRCNLEYFKDNNFSDDILEGIKARAFRAMPSLLRDLCFNKYVYENLPCSDVVYDIILDIQEGIDLLIHKKNGIYAVCLYTNTKRAYEGRKAKENRHKQFDNVKYIEFPVTFTPSHSVGDYFLYGEEEYNNLLTRLDL